MHSPWLSPIIGRIEIGKNTKEGAKKKKYYVTLYFFKIYLFESLLNKNFFVSSNQ